MGEICECLIAPIYDGGGEWHCPECHSEYDESEFNSKILWLRDREIESLRARVAELEVEGEQPVKVPETEECKHYSTSTGYDHNTCNDCGMISTDGGWGIASYKWFKSVAEAKFYEANGRLPD